MNAEMDLKSSTLAESMQLAINGILEVTARPNAYDLAWLNVKRRSEFVHESQFVDKTQIFVAQMSARSSWGNAEVEQ